MNRPRNDAQLLAWVAAIIQREQGAGTYGSVTVTMENGEIKRAKVEKNEIPQSVDNKK